MLELHLRRKILTNECTVGELSIKGLLPTWHTLEDIDRDLNQDGDLNDSGETKIWGQTCIPSGTYDIEWRMSPSKGKLMPYLKDVPNYSGVMIHPGNKTTHTNGCILLGLKLVKLTETMYEVASSVVAWNQLEGIFKKKDGTYKHGTITISYA